MRWAVESGSAEDGLTATILAAVWPSFLCLYRDVRRGCKWLKYGRLWPFLGVWLGLCAAMMKGGESGGIKMALKRGWESVGRRQKREALAEAGASFFVVCRMGGKRRFLL